MCTGSYIAFSRSIISLQAACMMFLCIRVVCGLANDMSSACRFMSCRLMVTSSGGSESMVSATLRSGSTIHAAVSTTTSMSLHGITSKKGRASIRPCSLCDSTTGMVKVSKQLASRFVVGASPVSARKKRDSRRISSALDTASAGLCACSMLPASFMHLMSPLTCTNARCRYAPPLDFQAQASARRSRYALRESAFPTNEKSYARSAKGLAPRWMGSMPAWSERVQPRTISAARVLYPTATKG
mmetsp:Transcript_20847/g.52498  ORF Transcript_20847/g.52498 Transcript_20847/m.52498 type:complete len:243 (-) Transcript_20847:807-1535(-)